MNEHANILNTDERKTIFTSVQQVGYIFKKTYNVSELNEYEVNQDIHVETDRGKGVVGRKGQEMASSR